MAGTTASVQQLCAGKELALRQQGRNRLVRRTCGGVMIVRRAVTSALLFVVFESGVIHRCPYPLC